MVDFEHAHSSVIPLEQQVRRREILEMVESLADIGEPGSDPLGHDHSVQLLETVVKIRELVIAGREKQAEPAGVGNGE